MPAPPSARCTLCQTTEEYELLRTQRLSAWARLPISRGGAPGEYPVVVVEYLGPDETVDHVKVAPCSLADAEVFVEVENQLRSGLAR